MRACQTKNAPLATYNSQDCQYYCYCCCQYCFVFYVDVTMSRILVKSRESAMQGWRRIPAGCQAWIPGRDNWYQGRRETQVFLTIEIISRRLSTKSTDLGLSMEIPQKCFNKAWERGQLSPQEENSIRRWLRNDSKLIKMISLGKMYLLPKKRILWEP